MMRHWSCPPYSLPPSAPSILLSSPCASPPRNLSSCDVLASEPADLPLSSSASMRLLASLALLVALLAAVGVAQSPPLDRCGQPGGVPPPLCALRRSLPAPLCCCSCCCRPCCCTHSAAPAVNGDLLAPGFLPCAPAVLCLQAGRADSSAPPPPPTAPPATTAALWLRTRKGGAPACLCPAPAASWAASAALWSC